MSAKFILPISGTGYSTADATGYAVDETDVANDFVRPPPLLLELTIFNLPSGLSSQISSRFSQVLLVVPST